jgi:hypothetical protein
MQPAKLHLFYNFPVTQILTQHQQCSTQHSW